MVKALHKPKKHAKLIKGVRVTLLAALIFQSKLMFFAAEKVSLGHAVEKM